MKPAGLGRLFLRGSPRLLISLYVFEDDLSRHITAVPCRPPPFPKDCLVGFFLSRQDGGGIPSVRAFVAIRLRPVPGALVSGNADHRALHPAAVSRFAATHSCLFASIRPFTGALPDPRQVRRTATRADPHAATAIVPVVAVRRRDSRMRQPRNSCVKGPGRNAVESGRRRRTGTGCPERAARYVHGGTGQDPGARNRIGGDGRPVRHPADRPAQVLRDGWPT